MKRFIGRPETTLAAGRLGLLPDAPRTSLQGVASARPDHPDRPVATPADTLVFWRLRRIDARQECRILAILACATGEPTPSPETSRTDHDTLNLAFHTRADATRAPDIIPK